MGSVGRPSEACVSSKDFRASTNKANAPVDSGVIERNGVHDDAALRTVWSNSLNPYEARVLVTPGLTNPNDAAEIQRMFNNR